MGKGIRGGIIVGVAVLVAAIGYSVLYFQHDLIRYEHSGLSIVLVLVWALVVAVLLLVLWHRMLVREEYLRKFYLSAETLFNFELGAVQIVEAISPRTADALAEYLRVSLLKLTYEGSPLTPPEDFVPTLCVSTQRFSAGGEGKDWHGVLQRVVQREDGHRTFVEIAAFDSIDELKRILKDTGF